MVEALHRVIRLFGVQRCMFASNAPVDQQDGWPPSRVFRVTSLNFNDFFACYLGCVMGRLWNSIKMKDQVPSSPSVFWNEIGKRTIELMRYQRIKQPRFFDQGQGVLIFVIRAFSLAWNHGEFGSLFVMGMILVPYII